MPDFDTRRPQEPDRPSRMHMFVAASRQHMFGVASRLRTPVRALLRNRNMLLRLALAVGILVVVVEWAYVISRAVEETPAEQLDHKIQIPPAPAYNEVAPESDSPADYCELSEEILGNGGYCTGVSTEAAGAMRLASITENLYEYQDYALKVEFYSRFADSSSSPFATSYCFERKNVAAYALSSALDNAELVGKTTNCYLAIFEGYGPELKPLGGEVKASSY